MTRRGNGEGTIRKRADGRWEALLTVTRDGRIVRRSIYAHTREEVARLLRRALRESEAGVPPASGTETLATFLAVWLEATRSSLRPQTWSTYERHLRLHVLPYAGRIRLAKLQPYDLQALYRGRLEEGLSSTTVHHVHAILHRALGQAVRWGTVPRNVADLVDPPRMSRFEMRALTAGEVRRLLDAARGDRLEALYVLAVSTGMRRGELLALHWQDVDLPLRRASVTGTMQRTPEGLVIGQPKTSKSRRLVMLSDMALRALERRREIEIAERASAGPLWYETGLIFPNAIGRPLEPGNLLRRSYWPLLQRAGLPRMRFHDLRHTAATIMLSRGVHPKVASEILGHATVAITLDLYSHVTESMQAEAAQLMDETLAGPIPSGA